MKTVPRLINALKKNKKYFGWKLTHIANGHIAIEKFNVKKEFKCNSYIALTDKNDVQVCLDAEKFIFDTAEKHSEMIKEETSYFLLMFNASMSQALYFKDGLRQDDQIRLETYFTAGERLIKSLVGDSLKNDEIDEALEEGAEMFNELARTFIECIKKEKGVEALEAVKLILNNEVQDREEKKV